MFSVGPDLGDISNQNTDSVDGIHTLWFIELAVQWCLSVIPLQLDVYAVLNHLFQLF